MLIIIHTESKGNVAGVFNTYAWNIPPNSNAANSTTLQSQSSQYVRNTPGGGCLAEFWKKLAILLCKTILYRPFWRPSYLSRRTRPLRAICKSLLWCFDWLILSTRNYFLWPSAIVTRVDATRYLYPYIKRREPIYENNIYKLTVGSRTWAIAQFC